MLLDYRQYHGRAEQPALTAGVRVNCILSLDGQQLPVAEIVMNGGISHNYRITGLEENSGGL